MATPAPTAPAPRRNVAPYGDSDSDGQASGGRRAGQLTSLVPAAPGLVQPAGQLLKGATDDSGQLKNPAFLLGVKLDVEAEVHLSARVKGDISVGLY
ncbi:hypothetical protein F4778DRAFT_784936 [Xylariomycetidae sp. FL2044]|nr:hypothetical protein F4778DRAFT_784936 [Xylariomycetidae sp. FL2044]